MEIEKKYLVKEIPFDLSPYKKLVIKQAYISFTPTIRLRSSNEDFFLCVKSKGHLAREEFELPLSLDEFNELWKKTEGYTIEKIRYLIPIENGLLAELDIFGGIFSPLLTVEVEFESMEIANNFVPPCWFSEELTYKSEYKNSNLAKKGVY